MNTLPDCPARNRRGILGRLLTGLALVVGLSGVNAPAADAAGQTLGVCSATMPLNLAPGLRLLVPTQGTNQSFGETGTLRCSGTIDGHTITGPGTIGFSGRYAGTCLRASGGGTWSFSIPVNDNGVVRVLRRSGTYDAPNVEAVIVFTGRFPGGRMAGTGLVVPVHGDCNLTTMTKANFSLPALTLTQ